ncbi:hypothetical protein [Paenibacillus sp. HGH0039]|uniref:hypothetical protein n=1 Tax=Paenibacillus sp. HGH0039 TaxID=1078505 RepID=UPI00034E5FB9|nr:hypothetical protein [Paenibacillus sp. HGH0039]EPD81312.1 hypothetical protein HMPREF1207_05069 [Paenibacillus sp. HGH0039]
MIIEYLRFLLFNAIEMSACLILIMAWFNEKVKWYITELAIASVVFPSISYIVIKFYGSLSLNMMIQFILIQLFFVFILRPTIKRKIFYSIWIVLFGYFSYLAIQTSIAWIAETLNYMSINEVTVSFSSKGENLQIISAFFALSVSGYKIFMREPFILNFRSIGKSRAVYVLIASMGLISEIIALKFFIFSNNSFNFIAYSIILFTVFLLLIYYTNKRDKDEANDNLARTSHVLQKERSIKQQ